MPELPEVEVTKMGISPHLIGEKIHRIDIRNGQLRWPVSRDIDLSLHRSITGVTRRAKYLLIHFDVGDIVLHLGMSGKLIVLNSDATIEKHDHIIFHLNSGKSLRFNDPRRFGSCLWQPEGTEIKQLKSLGPEPLTDEFNVAHLVLFSAKRKQPIKSIIMNNQVVVGVGNIYANEALFIAGIDPTTAGGSLNEKRLGLLVEAIKKVLQQAIKQGGTTLKDFTQADGKPGYFVQELRVYGRKGQSCYKCGETIESITIAQRNTFYCATCQLK